MASPRKNKSSSPPASPTEHRSLEDFAPISIPVRSFFAGEYLRLAKEIRLALFHGKIVKTRYGFYELDQYKTLPIGTSVEYLYDVTRLGKSYHECQWTDSDGLSYVLHLKPDEIEVVRPI